MQKVYRSQGVDINDKHIEIIVRSMLRKVKIIEGGDTHMLPGQLVEAAHFNEVSERVQKDGRQASRRRRRCCSASRRHRSRPNRSSRRPRFQETTRVLTDAAIKGKYDPLLGLKENVIIGKLIPAGTGMSRYRNIEIEPQGQDVDDEGRARTPVDFAFGGMTADEAAFAEVMAGGGTGDGVSRLMSAYERNREPQTVQYEGEYEDHATVHAPAKKTQYDRIKGINPEEL